MSRERFDALVNNSAPKARPAPHPTAHKTRGGDPAGAERGVGAPASDGAGGSGGAKPPGLVEELEQELRQALAIEPSADFARQVRARIERPHPWRWQWPLAVAAAACVVAVGLGWRVNRESADPPATLNPARLARDVELQPAPSGSAPPLPSRPPSGIAKKIAPGEPEAGVSVSEPEIIMPPDRARALARLLELARNGDLDEQKLRPVAAAAVPATLEVEPINVPLLLTPPIDIQTGAPRGGAGRE